MGIWIIKCRKENEGREIANENETICCNWSWDASLAIEDDGEKENADRKEEEGNI